MLGSDRSDLGQMTLESAFSLIKPLTYLAQVPSKSHLQYFQVKPLKKFHQVVLTPPTAGDQKFKREGHGKEFHLTTETPAGYLTHVLNKSCEFLLKGTRMEFVLHQRHSKDKLGPSIDFALKNSPHLRPDTILRAMPEGTTIVAHPCNAPETRSKAEKLANVDPPLLWALQHTPSRKRLGILGTPKWIDAMAKWDVELMADPSIDGKQKVKQIWKYSAARDLEMARKKKASRANPHSGGENGLTEGWQSMKLDKVVP